MDIINQCEWDDFVPGNMRGTSSDHEHSLLLGDDCLLDELTSADPQDPYWNKAPAMTCGGPGWGDASAPASTTRGQCHGAYHGAPYAPVHNTVGANMGSLTFMGHGHEAQRFGHHHGSAELGRPVTSAAYALHSCGGHEQQCGRHPADVIAQLRPGPIVNHLMHSSSHGPTDQQMYSHPAHPMTPVQRPPSWQVTTASSGGSWAERMPSVAVPPSTNECSLSACGGYHPPVASFMADTIRLPDSTNKQFQSLMSQLELSHGEEGPAMRTLTSPCPSSDVSTAELFKGHMDFPRVNCPRPSSAVTPTLTPSPMAVNSLSPGTHTPPSLDRMASVSGPAVITRVHQAGFQEFKPVPPPATHRMTIIKRESVPETVTLSPTGSSADHHRVNEAAVTTQAVLKKSAPRPAAPAAKKATNPSRKRSRQDIAAMAVKHDGSPPVRKSSKRMSCWNCGAHSTPQWRCGPDGPRTLCNACGVRYKKGLPLAYWEAKIKAGLVPGAQPAHSDTAAPAATDAPAGQE